MTFSLFHVSCVPGDAFEITVWEVTTKILSTFLVSILCFVDCDFVLKYR